MNLTAASQAAVLLLTAVGWSDAFQTTTRPSVRVVHTQYHQRFLVAPVLPSLHSSTKDEEVIEVITTSSLKDSLTFENPVLNKIGTQPIPYSELTIGVLKESFPGENRVSQTPDAITSLVKAGFNVIVQAGGECIEWSEQYDRQSQPAKSEGHTKKSCLLKS